MNKKFMGDYQQPEIRTPGTKQSSAVVHLAGEFKDGKQTCSRCGLILATGKKAIAPPGNQVTVDGGRVILGAVYPSTNCKGSG